jgi:ATP-binding cassette subfamily C protein
MDLLGVILFGLVGSITITSIQSTSPNPTVVWFVEFMNLDLLSPQSQVTILATVSMLILIVKSYFAAKLQKKTLRFLSMAGVDLTVKICRQMLNSSLDTVRRKTEKQALYAATSGVEEMTLRVLGAAVSLTADFVLLMLLGTLLLIASPSMTFVLIVIFLVFFLFIQKSVNSKARIIGSGVTRTTINSNEVFSEAYSAFREVVVRNQIEFIVSRLQKSRLESAKFQAQSAFLPFVSKYLMEGAVLLVGFSLAGISFLTSEAATAAGKLSLFFIASTRIAPALMRIQQGFYSLNMGSESAWQTIDFTNEMSDSIQHKDLFQESSNDGHKISVRNCSFSFTDSAPIISDINLTIEENSRIAFVGPSGGGKTTLADLILGLLVPSEGDIKIGRLKPKDFAHSGSGLFAYVPQDPFIANDSIFHNVTLGYDSRNFSEQEIWQVLEMVNLSELKEISRGDINAIMGETGIKLSGGQKQKIAIARAVITQPKILILDEATSALDADSEFLITNLVESLFKESTIITIAHRLSTIVSYPKIIYIAGGRIVAQGTFEELRGKINDFDSQAKRMGFQ